MSEEIKQDNNGKETSKDLSFIINLKAEGGLDIQAPGDGTRYDLPICFYMLDMAKDFIKAHNAKINTSRIVKPSVINRMKGAFGGR